ncbi:MAG: hypothetical protein HY903_11175 [Deltaproteobacteria bacterium]|nr:hypothetical protein [Deltaproteobacteria bacterium]
MRVLRELKDGTVLLRALSGRLDDSFDAAVLQPAGAKFLVLDVAHIKQLSSVGVRDWINAVRAVRQQVEGLFFVRASPRMSDQFNMVVGFDGGGSLLSFRSYYQCDSCGE